jgi:hypothetical protein
VGHRVLIALHAREPLAELLACLPELGGERSELGDDGGLVERRPNARR